MSQFLPMLSVIPLIGFWMWMFAEMARNPNLSVRDKYIWALLLTFTNVFGAVYYWVKVYRDQP